MLLYHHHQRQEQIVRVLVVTKEAMESLSQYGILFSYGRRLRPRLYTGEAAREMTRRRVVGFDWAGVSGKVEYPLRRNEEIPWPDDAGMPIYDGHDKNLLMACLSQINQ
jgi:hypothetical protein